MPEQQLEDEQFLRRKGEKTRVRAGHGLQSYIQVRLLSSPEDSTFSGRFADSLGSRASDESRWRMT
jgi:hypothetical protein